MERILVCTAWPYANGPLHLGHIAGCYLPADIFARYQRMAGREVLMVSGSDQHGTPITVTAEAEGVSPEEVAERYHAVNSRCMEDLGISFDLFSKTHHPTHVESVQDVFTRLREKGYIYTRTVSAAYCPACGRFLPDRYVEGTCPYCSFEGARGDQCDACGHTLDPQELVNPRCKLCGATPEYRDTEHFFLRLSAFEDRLKEWVRDKIHWRANTRRFTENWLREGLKDRAITRDLLWGVPIPVPGYDDKRIYVWFEAVNGYLSCSKEWARLRGEPDAWRAYWEDPTVRHYYFLAKDNIPFHTIIWPAILMGYGGLTLPYDVPANEYLTLDSAQFSKSRKHAIWVPEYLSRYSPDPLRFYLTENMPENRDSDFSWEGFVRANNNSLVGTIGNFIHRALTFGHKHWGGVPPQGVLGDDDGHVLRLAQDTAKSVAEHLERCSFKEALKAYMALAHECNRYFVRSKPWDLIKEDRARCATVIHVSIWLSKALIVMMRPFLPHASERGWRLLGYEGAPERWGQALEGLNPGPLPRPTPLFEKLDMDRVLEAEKRGGETWPLDLAVARVERVELHPEAEKLYVLHVDVGDGQRTLVAGLRPYYRPEEIEGRLIVVVRNLKPAKLRGILSEGMLLAADDGSTVALLTPLAGAEPGTRVGPSDGWVADTEPGQVELKAVAQLGLRVGLARVEGGAVLLESGGRGVPPKGVDLSPALVEGRMIAFPSALGPYPLVTEEGIPVGTDRPVKPGSEVH